MGAVCCSDSGHGQGSSQQNSTISTDTQPKDHNNYTQTNSQAELPSQNGARPQPLVVRECNFCSLRAKMCLPPYEPLPATVRSREYREVPTTPSQPDAIRHSSENSLELSKTTPPPHYVKHESDVTPTPSNGVRSPEVGRSAFSSTTSQLISGTHLLADVDAMVAELQQCQTGWVGNFSPPSAAIPVPPGTNDRLPALNGM